MPIDDVVNFFCNVDCFAVEAKTQPVDSHAKTLLSPIAFDEEAIPNVTKQEWVPTEFENTFRRLRQRSCAVALLIRF